MRNFKKLMLYSVSCFIGLSVALIGYNLVNANSEKETVSKYIVTNTDFIIPYNMQPNTIIVFDNNLKPKIEKGGYIKNQEFLPKEENLEKNDYFKIYKGMKVVYDDKGELNNFYYVDKYCPSGYSLHGEDEHQKN